MKIFKFLSVDAKTGISVEIERSLEGPTRPNLPGIGEVFSFGGWMYAEADDTAEANPGNYIFEVTEADFEEAIRGEFEGIKTARIASAYEEEEAFVKHCLVISIMVLLQLLVFISMSKQKHC